MRHRDHYDVIVEALKYWTFIKEEGFTIFVSWRHEYKAAVGISRIFGSTLSNLCFKTLFCRLTRCWKYAHRRQIALSHSVVVYEPTSCDWSTVCKGLPGPFWNHGLISWHLGSWASSLHVSICPRCHNSDIDVIWSASVNMGHKNCAFRSLMCSVIIFHTYGKSSFRTQNNTILISLLLCHTYDQNLIGIPSDCHWVW